jgi:L-asparagine oxygenase
VLSVHDPVRAAEDYVTEAQLQAARLSEPTRRALLAFRRFGSDSGGLLIRGMPIGEVPATPTTADRPLGIGLPAAGIMSVLVATLGEQYGFQPERSGQIVQDVLPVTGEEQIQSSISSDVPLEDHIEMAFSEYRSDFVVLACLRPDHNRSPAQRWCRDNARSGC